MGTSRTGNRIVIGFLLALVLAAPGTGRAAGVLDTAAASLAATLAAGHGAGSPPLVFVASQRFLDPITGNVYPLAEPLAAAMRTALAATGAFAVTSDPQARPDLYLNGYIYRTGDHVVLGCRLVNLTDVTRAETKDVAASRYELPLDAVEEGLLQPSLKSKMLYLMQRLQARYLESGFTGVRPRVQVEPFCRQSDALYSPFPTVLQDYAREFLKASAFLAPFEGAQGRLEALARERAAGPRIVTAQTVPGAMAALCGADLYLAGTYRVGEASVELTALLASADGGVMVADSTGMPAWTVEPALLAQPQAADPGFMSALAAVSRLGASRGLKIEVFTQKGKENVHFAPGEHRVVFFRPVGRSAHVRLFLRDAGGAVTQLWPNATAKGDKPLAAGEVVSLPGPGYAKDFALTVGPAPGGELLFAFASDKPLPAPTGLTAGAHGLGHVGLDPAGLAAFYDGWAKGERARLAGDVVPIFTGK